MQQPFHNSLLWIRLFPFPLSDAFCISKLGSHFAFSPTAAAPILSRPSLLLCLYLSRRTSCSHFWVFEFIQSCDVLFSTFFFFFFKDKWMCILPAGLLWHLQACTKINIKEAGVVHWHKDWPEHAPAGEERRGGLKVAQHARSQG